MAECYHLGVNAYVVKPVRFNEFVEAGSRLGIFRAPIRRAAAGVRRRA